MEKKKIHGNQKYFTDKERIEAIKRSKINRCQKNNGIVNHEIRHICLKINGIIFKQSYIKIIKKICKILYIMKQNSKMK